MYGAVIKSKTNNILLIRRLVPIRTFPKTIKHPNGRKLGDKQLHNKKDKLNKRSIPKLILLII